MSDHSPVLKLPYIQAAQAQKHVTHNEALRQLDVLVQLSVLTHTRTTPPADPAPGACHLVGANGAGAWAGHDHAIALWSDGAWLFHPPQPGWRVYSLETGTILVFDAGTWAAPALKPAQLGINASADATNRLAVAGPATLFTHTGAGHRLTLNKAATPHTASLLFQTGWSGRAEMGTAGDDDFAIKVSADGETWTEAFSIAAGSGLASGAAVQDSATDTTAGRLMGVGAFGLGALKPPVISDFTTALLPGFHRYIESRATGAPGQKLAYHGWALVNRLPNGWCMVLAGRYTRRANQARIWMGMRAAATGALAWHEIWHAGSLVGTVAQADGQPAGAVIEQATNANGSYVRFADGTQIATNANAAISVAPAAFAGTVTRLDGDKMWVGRWF